MSKLDAGNLYFYRARYYNASPQRFISEDPARFSGGLNFYSYVRNSPSNYRDPFGLYTLQLGLNVSGTLFNITGSFFLGVVIDTNLNVGYYDGYGLGLGEGVGVAGGGWRRL